MSKNKIKGYVLVFIQFATICYVYFTTSWIIVPAWCWGLIAIGGLIAIWAIGIMQLDNLRITPTPHEQSRLVIHGPYRFIRHPMYLSLFFITFPPIVAQFSYLRLSMGILMVIDLIFKLNFEEKLLNKKFSEYEAYSRKTYRIIPFLY